MKRLELEKMLEVQKRLEQNIININKEMNCNNGCVHTKVDDGVLESDRRYIAAIVERLQILHR